MQFDLALVDLVRSYLLKGETTTWHAALSVIFVESYETAMSADGTCILGIARFSGDVDPPSFDPVTGTLRAGAANIEGHPRSQPNRRDPWLDITDARVEFALTVPRAAGQIVAAGVASVPGSATAFQPMRNVLTTLDANPADAPPSDYPGTGFTLDMVLSGIEVHPPFLKPAKMEPNGLLVPDSSRPDVVFLLPKVKLRVSQGSDNAAVLEVSLVLPGGSPRTKEPCLSFMIRSALKNTSRTAGDPSRSSSPVRPIPPTTLAKSFCKTSSTCHVIPGWEAESHLWRIMESNWRSTWCTELTYG